MKKWRIRIQWNTGSYAVFLVTHPDTAPMAFWNWDSIWEWFRTHK